jgi:C4-dicarboxylate-specific signal transduction histidine kinase/ActR/RegA family two-component response regulator
MKTPENPNPETAAPQSFTLIVVDDEQSIAQCLVKDLREIYSFLPDEALRIEAANSKAEALELVEDVLASQSKIPLVISDFAMPQGSGVDLFEELRIKREIRDTRLLLLSGQVNHQTISAALASEVIDGYLVKPYQINLLRDEVKRLVSQYFIRFHRDLIPLYPRLVSHEAYVRALEETESQRLKLTHQFRALKASTLAPHHTSDQDVLDALSSSLKHWIESKKRHDLVREFNASQVILEENEANQSLWFVLDGEVCQDKEGQWGRVLLSQNSRGNLFGLLSFMTSNRSFSRVYAKTACRIVRCGREDLEQIFNEEPDFIFQLLNTVLRILKNRLLTVSETKVELQNTLQSLEQAQVQLVEAEKMATIGIMTAGVAHELNNPATALERGSEHLMASLLNLLKDFAAGKIPSPALLECGTKLCAVNPLQQATSSSELREKTTRYSAQMPRSLARKKAEMELALGQDDHALVEKALSNPQDIDRLYVFYEIGLFLHHISSCSQRIAHLVTGMKNYARAETSAFESVDVAAGIEDTYWVLQNRLKHYNFEKIYKTHDKVWGVPSQLNQIWTNLINNACDASQPGSTIKVEVENVQVHGEHYIKISVKDEGTGIPDELKNKIFEPQFTTKKGQDGHYGLGLGLAIVKKIIKDHNGKIEFQSQKNIGTTFMIFLPLFGDTSKA